MSDRGQDAVRWHLFDRLVVVYCALMLVLLALFGRPWGEYVDELAFYTVCLGLTLAIVNLVDETRGGWRRLLRLLYPALLFSFFYRATGGTMFLIFDGFFDASFTAWEASIFGVNPTLFIDRHLLNPLLNEVFLLGYFLYYLLIPAFLLLVYFRRDWSILRNAMAAFCAIFFVSYLMFMLFPLEGPRYFFADQYTHDVVSPVARQLAQFVINNAAVHGGCMPSSHFAIALSIALYVWRFYRPYRWPVALVAGTLALGTFWGRYHYVTDVFVGGAIALVVTLLMWRRLPEGSPTTSKERDPAQPEIRHVS